MRLNINVRKLISISKMTKNLNKYYRIFNFVCYSGIRDIGRKNGYYQQRIDMINHVPWWRQMHDTELLYDPTAEIFNGIANNTDPSNDHLPIFDDGCFFEDNVEISPGYLKAYKM